MKKITTIFLTVLLLCPVAFSQTAYNYLSAGNTIVQVNNNGMLFNDIDFNNIGFEVPKGSGLTTMYTSSLWIGGLDEQNKLRLAAQTYGQTGSDYFAGPIDKTGMAVNPANWNYIYKVSAEEIELHKLSYTEPNYVVPTNIANWPVDYGDGFDGPYATFFDKDQDGEYEPAEGDYPVIMGNEESYFVMNDLYSIHSESNAMQMGIEVRVHTYVFTDDEVGNAVFVRYEIINKSDRNYIDVHAGIFTDFDLGDYSDDLVGTDENLDMYYAYNGSPSDALYGAKPPAQAVVFLNQPLTYSVAYNNDWGPQGNPTTAEHYYNYISGKGLDGNPFPEPLAYTGDPCNNTGNLQTGSGDRRMLGSTNGFNLAAGGTYKFDVAYVYAQGTSNTQSVCELRDRVSTIKQLYNNGGITTVKAVDKNAHPVKVYPNPTDGSATVTFYNPNKEIFSIEVYNTVGQLVLKEDTREPQFTLPEGEMQEGIYYVRVRKKSDKKDTDSETVKLVVN